MAEQTLEQKGLARLKHCRQAKSHWIMDFRECYFFTAPHRMRTVESTSKPPATHYQDAVELNTDLAFDLTQEFVTEAVNTYMPEGQPWCERGPGMFLLDDAWDKVKDDVRKADQKIFSAMKASNLYPELTKSFYPDLAIGTVALWVERPHPSAAITVWSIPLRELECNLGPYGEIDDRWAIRYTRNSYVRELVGEAVWAKIEREVPEVPKAVNDQPERETEVRFGFWRLWDRMDDEWWQRVVYVGDKLVDDGALQGEGSCPLIVGRWNPSADWPWGLGPMIQALPSLRQIDELEAMLIQNVEMHIAPPITFPVATYGQVEQGFESNMAYPVERGDAVDVKPMYQLGPPDAGVYQYEQKEHRLRRLFFVDFPQQTGDTPPTLGQWLDEMARAQRRIGTPGLPFWREVPAKIFMRFQHLLERARTIPQFKVDGVLVSLQPRNPAQAAAEQQEVGMAVKAIQILGGAFPEEFKVLIDGKMSMEAILEKMRVTLLKFRAPDDVKQAVAQIAQLVQGRQRPEGAEAPNPPPTPGIAA
jgi:hypothetical protein